MQKTKINGVFKDRNQLFTENQIKGSKVYNEKLVKKKDKEFRSWNPYRSKLAAAILKGFEFEVRSDFNVLYLGAATGTTVSHISDILTDKVIYAVENSPVALKGLLKLCEKRKNIIPVFSDAFHPDRYNSIVSQVDIVYQDISQRNQAEIFVKNINQYLKKNSIGIIMVKARSIDVSLKPEEVYDIVCSKLTESGYKIVNQIDLKPFEKDHAAIIVSNK